MTEKDHYLRAVERDVSKDTAHEESQLELAPDVPDIRVSLEQAIALWNYETDAYVDIEISGIEPRILEKLIAQIWDGIGERGACAQMSPTTIRAFYKTTDDSHEQQEAAREYAQALLKFLNLPESALIACDVVTVPYSDSDREEIDSLYQGLTALPDA